MSIKAAQFVGQSCISKLQRRALWAGAGWRAWAQGVRGQVRGAGALGGGGGGAGRGGGHRRGKRAEELGGGRGRERDRPRPLRGGERELEGLGRAHQAGAEVGVVDA